LGGEETGKKKRKVANLITCLGGGKSKKCQSEPKEKGLKKRKRQAKRRLQKYI